MKSFHSRKLVLAAAFVCMQPQAFAFDTASLELGSGTSTKLVRLGLQSKWETKWWQSNGTHVSGYWDATLAHWRGDRFQGVRGRSQSITAIGLTPVFRLQRDSGKGLYAEAGIGLHLLSDLYDNAGKQLSTRLQFGDHLAVGYVFQNELDLKLKLQHFSNGGFKKPNDGVNFAVFSASYKF